MSDDEDAMPPTPSTPLSAAFDFPGPDPQHRPSLSQPYEGQSNNGYESSDDELPPEPVVQADGEPPQNVLSPLKLRLRARKQAEDDAPSDLAASNAINEAHADVEAEPEPAATPPSNDEKSEPEAEPVIEPEAEPVIEEEDPEPKPVPAVPTA